MKLWLTLIFGTIAISASMTYLVMHQGAQTLPDPTPLDIEFSTPSKAEFGAGTLDSNVLDIDAGKSSVGKLSTITIPIKCTGDKPLKIELIRTGCSCVHTITFGAQDMVEKKPHTLQPGETAELKIPFTPKDDQAKSPQYRFRLTFNTNDPEYSPTFHVQVVTQVQPSQGTK